MYKSFNYLLLIFLLFLISTVSSYAANQTAINSELVVSLPPQQEEKEQTFIKMKADEFEAQKVKKSSDAVKLQAEQNIFNKNFEKSFETGIVKDVKLIGCNDLFYTAVSQSNGVSHNFVDNQLFMTGVQGHFRDGTIFNFTALPLMDVQDYDGFSHRLFEMYLKKPINKHHQIAVGQQRTPVSYEGSSSSFGLPIGRRSQFESKYSNIVALGTKVLGDWDRVEYQAGVFDTGRFLKDTFNTGPEFAGLISFKPIKNNQKYGKLKIGGSFNSGRKDYSYNVFSGHIVYDYKKFHTISEYSYANGYNGRANSANKSDGYYLTVMYDITPKIQIFSRVDTFNANKMVSGQTNTEYTAGFHYYLKGRKARFTLSYVCANSESKFDSGRLFTMMELLL